MAPEVRLSGPENEPLGIVSLAEALRMAGEADVDLFQCRQTGADTRDIGRRSPRLRRLRPARRAEHEQ